MKSGGEIGYLRSLFYKHSYQNPISVVYIGVSCWKPLLVKNFSDWIQKKITTRSDWPSYWKSPKKDSQRKFQDCKYNFSWVLLSFVSSPGTRTGSKTGWEVKEWMTINLGNALESNIFKWIFLRSFSGWYHLSFAVYPALKHLYSFKQMNTNTEIERVEDTLSLHILYQKYPSRYKVVMV